MILSSAISPRCTLCSRAVALTWRMARSTAASSSFETRSTLLRRITSANAICSPASSLFFNCSRTCFASTTVTIASSLVFARTSASTKKVCATGAGFAKPVVSTRMASKPPLRFIKPSMMRIRSPRTVQQTQPLFISKTSSSASTIKSLSIPISPNSFTMTAYFLPCCSVRIRFNRVVLPAPRKPVSTVTGTGWVMAP